MTCLFVVVESIYVWIVDHALVVGAGVGGLAASLVLSRTAARVTLVERAYGAWRSRAEYSDGD
jgi:2-polyprenyl-6-methoxyphenol hydroxylase-like FAD-dependent oxidoreductase